MSSYNPSISYLKALGIALMVLGHSGNGLHVNDFVYMFHMPLFFIASGYCFKPKYLDAPGQFLRSKIKGIWWPYVKWSLLFLLLHNAFYHLNIYNGEYGYNGNVSHLYNLYGICHTAFAIVSRLQGAEQLLGGYWFLNALFFGSIIAWIVLRLMKNALIGGGDFALQLYHIEQDLLACSVFRPFCAGFYRSTLHRGRVCDEEIPA